MKDEIIYSLNIDDIQTVAKEVLNRKLSENELKQVVELVPERINWFDSIETAILEKIHESV